MAETGDVGYVAGMSLSNRLDLEAIRELALEAFRASGANGPYAVAAIEDIGSSGDPIIWLEAHYRDADSVPAKSVLGDIALGLQKAVWDQDDDRLVHLLTKRDTDGDPPELN
jgi:hypothetical protein